MMYPGIEFSLQEHLFWYVGILLRYGYCAYAHVIGFRTKCNTGL